MRGTYNCDFSAQPTELEPYADVSGIGVSGRWPTLCSFSLVSTFIYLSAYVPIYLIPPKIRISSLMRDSHGSPRLLSASSAPAGLLWCSLSFITSLPSTRTRTHSLRTQQTPSGSQTPSTWQSLVSLGEALATSAKHGSFGPSETHILADGCSRS